MSDLSADVEEIVNGIVVDVLKQQETVEKAIPRPFGHREAPMEVRLQKFDRMMQLGPSAIAAVRKVFGRKPLADEFRELYPEWMKRRMEGAGVSQEAVEPPGAPSPGPAVGGESPAGGTGLPEGGQEVERYG